MTSTVDAMADEITDYARMGPGRKDLRDRVRRLLDEHLAARLAVDTPALREALEQTAATDYAPGEREALLRVVKAARERLEVWSRETYTSLREAFSALDALEVAPTQEEVWATDVSCSGPGCPDCTDNQ